MEKPNDLKDRMELYLSIARERLKSHEDHKRELVLKARTLIVLGIGLIGLESAFLSIAKTTMPVLFLGPMIVAYIGVALCSFNIIRSNDWSHGPKLKAVLDRLSHYDHNYGKVVKVIADSYSNAIDKARTALEEQEDYFSRGLGLLHAQLALLVITLFCVI